MAEHVVKMTDGETTQYYMKRGITFSKPLRWRAAVAKSTRNEFSAIRYDDGKMVLTVNGQMVEKFPRSPVAKKVLEAVK